MHAQRMLLRNDGQFVIKQGNTITNGFNLKDVDDVLDFFKAKSPDYGQIRTGVDFKKLEEALRKLFGQ